MDVRLLLAGLGLVVVVVVHALVAVAMFLAARDEETFTGVLFDVVAGVVMFIDVLLYTYLFLHVP